MYKVFKSTDKAELFNLAYLGVVAQGRASVMTKPDNPTSTSCAYQDSDDPNCKCGVGHCLTPEALDKVCSYIGSVDSMVGEFHYDDSFDYDAYADLEDWLTDLQGIHDDAENLAGQGADDVFMQHFKDGMMTFAAQSFPERTFDSVCGVL